MLWSLLQGSERSARHHGGRRAVVVVVIGTEDPTAWERLWPLLVTAALSLLVLAVVQLAVVPRLEVRKRREQRWEGDLMLLGEFLTFDYQQALDDYVSALRYGAMLAEVGPGELRPDHERDAWSRYHEMRRAAVDPYGRACSRLDWLAERVSALDRLHPRLWSVWTGCVQVNFALNSVDPRFRVDQDTLATPDEIDAAAQKGRQHLKAVVDDIKFLADRKPPTQASWLRRRARDRWRTLNKTRSQRGRAKTSPKDGNL